MKTLILDRSKLDGVVKTPQGFLKVPAVLTRVGVLKYKKPDGSIQRQLRRPEEVFKPESIATLRGLPLTNNHPTGLVTPENVKELTVGFTSDSVEVMEEKFLQSMATVMDAKAIADVEGGKVELSCGYLSDIVEKPGVWNGEEYDVEQTNIVYNHVSIVDIGRAGPEVRLRLDSMDAVLLTDEDYKGVIPMEKVKIGDQEFEMTPEAAKAVQDMMTKHADEMKAKADESAAVVEEKKEVEAKVEETQAALDTTQAKLDSALEELKLKNDSADLSGEKLQEAVNKRIKVLSVAKHIMKDSADIEKKSDLEIMKAVVTERSKTDLTGKSDTYIAARFDAISETVEADIVKKEEVTKSFSTHLDSTGADEGSAAEAKKRQDERSKNQWKQKA